MLPELNVKCDGVGFRLSTNLQAYDKFIRLVVIRVIAQAIEVSKDDIIDFMRSSISDDILSNAMFVDMNQLFNQTKGDEE